MNPTSMAGQAPSATDPRADRVPAPRPAPRGGRRARTAAGLLLLGVVGAWPALVPPAVVPASAPPTEFSAERAMVHVREIAQRPHMTGTAENARVRQYLVGQLAALGLEPEVQTTTGVARRFPVSGRVHNVLARIPGAVEGGPAVLLMAHYDAAAVSPGAGDDASGTSAVLETARALRAGAPLRNDVLLLLTDAEEVGLLGAAAFVAEHPWAERVAMVLNFEARGTRGRSLMFETAEGNAATVRAFARHAPHATGSSLMYGIYRTMPNDTDFSETRTLGAPGLNFAFIGGSENYHTPNDDVAHLDPRSVQHHGGAALAMTRHFGDAEFPLVPTGDVIFFNLPLLGLVAYPLAWTLPLALLAALAVLGAIGWGLVRGRLRWRAVALGLAGALGGLVLALLLGPPLLQGIVRVHGAMPEGGRPQGSTVYLFAVLALTLAVTAAVHRALRRRARPVEMLAGALLPWLALALATAVLFPAGSYLFLWPTLFAALALAAALAAPGGASRAAAAAAWAAAAATLFLVVPIGALVFLGLQLELPGAIALVLLASLAATLLVDQVEAMQGRRWWALPGALGALALLLLAAGLATVRYDAERPRPNQMIYFLNADSGRARWIDPRPRADSWTEQFRAMATVPSAPLPTARVTLLSEEVGVEGRMLRLRAQAPDGARKLTFRAPPGVVLRAAVDGRPVLTEGHRVPLPDWRLVYVSPPPEGVDLSLLVRAGAALDLWATAETAGLPELDGFNVRPRSPATMPAYDGDYSLVRRTFTF